MKYLINTIYRINTIIRKIFKCRFVYSFILISLVALVDLAVNSIHLHKSFSVVMGVISGFLVSYLLVMGKTEEEMIIENKPDLIIIETDDREILALKNIGKGTARSIKYNLYLHLGSGSVFSLAKEPQLSFDFLEKSEIVFFNKSHFFNEIYRKKQSFVHSTKDSVQEKPIFISRVEGKVISCWSLVFSYIDIWGTSYFSVFRYEKPFTEEGKWVYYGTFIGDYLKDASGFCDIGFNALFNQKKHRFVELEGFVNESQKSNYSRPKSKNFSEKTLSPIVYLRRLFLNQI